ncbi:MAG TPA: DUF4352 domain-containing protein [Micromonosporaceae bacterium]|nr:DUF4352 domain-containing protein [Micromonosporaceae bacterium]
MSEPPNHPGRPPARTEPDRRPRYRSLRDLAPGARRPARPVGMFGQSDGHGAFPSGGYQPVHSTPPQPDRQRLRGLRPTLQGALIMLLLVGLLWGGYAAYRYFAPYYGLGYITGRSGTVQDVVFTVTEARCGLDRVPQTDESPDKGQFCVVNVKATNNSPKSRYLSLSMFSMHLDTGSRANPVSRMMSTRSLELETGETRDLHLVYDILDGARMENLKVQIGYETSNIPLR